MNQKLIQSFRDYSGEEKFRKFVIKMNKNDRLLFWMERHWENFTSEHPQRRYTYVEMKDIFMFCPLHDERLKPQEFNLIPGLLKIPEEYRNAEKDLFPFGDTFMYDCWAEYGAKRTINVCQTCQRIAKEWIEKNDKNSFIANQIKL
jgi:hypothetical protein